MCLSTVYKDNESESNILMSNVENIEVSGDKVIVTDLMKRKLEIEGTLLYVDLIKNSAVVLARN